MAETIEKDGVEITVYTQEEVDAQAEAKVQAVLADKEKTFNEEKAALIAEAENAKRVAREQTDNFKKVREMSDDEKKKFTAEQIETMRRAELAEEKVKAFEDTFNAEVKGKVERAKEKAISDLVGDDKELREKILKNYDIINLTGTDEETIKQRAQMAYNMMGVKKYNPLTQSFSGEAPNIKSDKFTDTEKGKAAEAILDAQLGLKK